MFDFFNVLLFLLCIIVQSFYFIFNPFRVLLYMKNKVIHAAVFLLGFFFFNWCSFYFFFHLDPILWLTSFCLFFFTGLYFFPNFFFLITMSRLHLLALSTPQYLPFANSLSVPCVWPYQAFSYCYKWLSDTATMDSITHHARHCSQSPDFWLHTPGPSNHW